MSTLVVSSAGRLSVGAGSGRRPAVIADRAEVSTLRLTGRGRLLVLLAWLLVALVAAVSLAVGSVADLDAGAPAPARIVVVGPGDTLWRLAGDAAAASGERDVRVMVERIQQANGLESGMLEVGQQIRVPRG